MNSKGKGAGTGTEGLIRQVAFRHFLEKGYEATNLRAISDEVEIKAASLYFYFSSKKELFLSIYNAIYSDQLAAVNEIAFLNKKLEPMDLLYVLFRNGIRECMSKSAEYRFLMRYQLFPPEELTEETRQVFHKWQMEEYLIHQKLLMKCLGDGQETNPLSVKSLFVHYKRYQNALTYEMLFSGVATTEDEIEVFWERFCAKKLFHFSDKMDQSVLHDRMLLSEN